MQALFQNEAPTIESTANRILPFLKWSSKTGKFPNGYSVGRYILASQLHRGRLGQAATAIQNLLKNLCLVESFEFDSKIRIKRIVMEVFSVTFTRYTYWKRSNLTRPTEDAGWGQFRVYCNFYFQFFFHIWWIFGHLSAWSMRHRQPTPKNITVHGLRNCCQFLNHSQ